MNPKKNLEYEVVVEEDEVHPHIVNVSNFLLFVDFFVFLVFLLVKIYNEYKKRQVEPIYLYTKLNF